MSEMSKKFLYSSTVSFDEIQRVVWPPSWLGHTPFAMWLVEAMRPSVIVELGTHSGNSFSAFCQAVQQLRLTTKCFAIDTWKGDPHAGAYEESVYEDVKKYVDERYSGFAQLLRSTFEESVNKFADGSIDLLNIDGYHTYEATRSNFESWLAKMSPRGVILIHDINVRRDDFGAYRFWEEIQPLYPSFSFLHSYGLGVLITGSEIAVAVQALVQPKRDEDDTLIRTFFARLGDGPMQRALLDRQKQERSVELVQLAPISELVAAKAIVQQQAAIIAQQASTIEREQAGRQALDSTIRQQAAKIKKLLAELESLGASRQTAILWRQFAEERFTRFLEIAPEQLANSEGEPVNAEQWIHQQGPSNFHPLLTEIERRVGDYEDSRVWRVQFQTRLGASIEIAHHRIDVLESFVKAMQSPGHMLVTRTGRFVKRSIFWRALRSLKNLTRVVQTA